MITYMPSHSKSVLSFLVRLPQILTLIVEKPRMGESADCCHGVHHLGHRDLPSLIHDWDPSEYLFGGVDEQIECAHSYYCLGILGGRWMHRLRGCAHSCYCIVTIVFLK